MKILIHDYTAFSFPVQLSRELARRGHEVLHLYSDFDPRGGRLTREEKDPAGFQVEAVSIHEPFQKYRYVKRAIQEHRYGGIVQRHIAEFRPSVVFSSNTPVTISQQILRAAGRCGARYVHWTQDIFSLAAETVLSRRFGLPGRLMAFAICRIEADVINKADAAVVISEDFAKEFEAIGIRPRHTYVIPNWMPLDEMKPEPKDNPWSRRHGLADTLNIIYVGMLGLKHDSSLFIRLAQHFADRPQVRVVAVGAGVVFEQLQTAKREGGLDNLVLLGWQDYSEIALVFATGDILLSLIAPDASRFSVPCKVQSYASAGRAVLAAIPANNLAHRLIADNEIGLAVDPADADGVVEAAERLVDSADLRRDMAARGRQYAEEHFVIRDIGERFESIAYDVTGFART